MSASSSRSFVVSHPDDSGVQLVQSQPRAKAIARPSRVLSALVFDRACEASKLSNGVIARWLRVDERRVREMRTGESPVRLDAIVDMPPSLEWGIGVALQEHSKARALVAPGRSW